MRYQCSFRRLAEQISTPLLSCEVSFEISIGKIRVQSILEYILRVLHSSTFSKVIKVFFYFN